MIAKCTWHEPLLVLEEDRAADLMSYCPLSIRAGTPAKEALRLLTESGCRAAPVIDEAGRPVGVICRADLLGQGERNGGVQMPEYYTHPSPEQETNSLPPAEQPGRLRDQTVARIMTPVVFSIPIDTSAEEVIHKLLTWHLQRLFVTDRNGCLIGVLSTFDLLHHLRRRTAEEIPSCFPEVEAE